MCSSCSSQWTGANCTLFTVTNITNKASNLTANAFSLGTCFTFDGLVFVNTHIGNYYFMFSNVLKLQAAFVQCKRSHVCIKAIGMKYRNNTILLKGPMTERDMAIVLINGKTPEKLSVDISSENTLIKYQQLSRLRIKLTVSNSLILNIRVSSRFLDVSCVVTDKAFCFNNTGLWGSCNGNKLDDLYDYDNVLSGRWGNSTHNMTFDISKITQAYVIDVFVKSWTVNKTDDVFSNSGLNVSFLPYALTINKTIFVTNEIFTINGSDTTVEIYVKVIKQGVLWSYSTFETCGLFLNKTLLVFQNENIVDTGLVLNSNQWYKLSVVFERLTNTLKIYVVDMSGFFNLRTFRNIFRVPFFRPGGILTIGSWRSSATDNVNVAGFTGDVFQLLIWKKALTTEEIRGTVAAFIPCSTNDLASMWKFEQIEELVLKDCVSNVKLTNIASPISPVISWSRADLKNVYTVFRLLRVVSGYKEAS